ncbi:MAG: hypothetical protein KC897_05930 [Candidatus Omnitrophica bacterium]|nr:hypothetical protein [Candidatus Omnitrophota bacterium]MCB9722270.1 hypothetical protein [Candidatus Omnitrophota bacterium]
MTLDWDSSAQLYQQGRWALGEGDIAKGKEFLLESYHRAPHYKTAELLGELFLEQCEFLDALKYLSAAVGLNSRPFKSRYLLARAWLALEEKEDAIFNLEEALRLKEDFRSARELLETLR